MSFGNVKLCQKKSKVDNRKKIIINNKGQSERKKYYE